MHAEAFEAELREGEVSMGVGHFSTASVHGLSCTVS